MQYMLYVWIYGCNQAAVENMLLQFLQFKNISLQGRNMPNIITYFSGIYTNSDGQTVPLLDLNKTWHTYSHTFTLPWTAGQKTTGCTVNSSAGMKVRHKKGQMIISITVGAKGRKGSHSHTPPTIEQWNSSLRNVKAHITVPSSGVSFQLPHTDLISLYPYTFYSLHINCTWPNMDYLNSLTQTVDI